MATTRGSISILLGAGSQVDLSAAGSVPTLAGWGLMRYSGSLIWTDDPNLPMASLCATIGMLMAPSDPRTPFVYGGVLKNFHGVALTAGALNIIFYEGGTISL